MSVQQLEIVRAALLRQRAMMPDDIEGQRALVAQGMTPFRPLKGVQRTPVAEAGVAGEWFDVPDADESRILYYLHGGAYCLCSVDTHSGLIANLSRAASARTFALEYRLAPEHPHPAAVEDAVRGYHWLLSLGIPAHRIVIAGDSAGGGLTLATLLALRDAGEPLPAAAVVLSPWTDMLATGESMRTRAERDPFIDAKSGAQFTKWFLAGGDPRDPLASPLHGNLEGLPPLLIHVGDDEILLDDSTRFAAKADLAGVDVTLNIYAGMIHVWHFFAGIVDESMQAITEIGEYIKMHTPHGIS